MLAVPLVACGGDDSTGPSDSYSGTYTLRTINGQNLPFVIIQVGADRIEWMSDKVTLSDNGSTGGSFTQHSTFRLTEAGQATTETAADAGSYARNGTAATFTFNSDGSSASGTISGGKITIGVDVEGAPFSLVYQK
jgi:hypothetical protein